MSDIEIKARARQIMEKAVHSVFVTLDNDGFPHARTMWTAGMDDDFTIYYVTGRDLLKCKQIADNPKICAFWTEVEGSTIAYSYVQIKGEATITDDQGLRDRFWNDMLKEYFPLGATDPNYVAIVVKPKELILMDSHKYPLDHIEFA